MRTKKIGILCIQETHLTNEYEAQVDTLYSRRLRVINSKDPSRPGSSAGVAFVLNKEILDTTNVETFEIIPGRALAIKIKRNNNENLTLLNIYAPNNLTKHPEFWELISRTWQNRNLPQPDFLLGDFNLTEDSIDRAPARQDNENALTALRDLKHQLNVQDTWRSLHPTSRLFTYYSSTNSHSRLDRIYTSPRHERNTHQWDSCITAIPTDHKMVLVRFVPQNAPFIGKGRWTWPMSLMNDKNLFEKISNLGIAAQQEITHQREHRTELSNPQKTWKDFKANINNEAKKTAKEHLHKIKQRTKQLEDDIKRTLDNGDIDTNE
ncbi:DNase I-like protein, partial [Suillus brevipes Sb2]